MIELIKLKTKLAEIHLDTNDLGGSLLVLKKTVANLDIDEVVSSAMQEEISRCLELNRGIREKSKGGLK